VTKDAAVTAAAAGAPTEGTLCRLQLTIIVTAAAACCTLLLLVCVSLLLLVLHMLLDAAV
jgi:hypothetical protein